MKIIRRDTCTECCQSHAVIEFLSIGYEDNERLNLCQGCLRKAIDALQGWKDRGRKEADLIKEIT